MLGAELSACRPMVVLETAVEHLLQCVVRVCVCVCVCVCMCVCVCVCVFSGRILLCARLACFLLYNFCLSVSWKSAWHWLSFYLCIQLIFCFLVSIWCAWFLRMLLALGCCFRRVGQPNLYCDAEISLSGIFNQSQFHFRRRNYFFRVICYSQS